MKDDFVGYNSLQLKVDVRKFQEHCEDACKELGEVFNQFMIELSLLWASPNAILFGEKYSNKYLEISRTISYEINELNDRLIHSITSFVSAHGDSINLSFLEDKGDYSTHIDFVFNEKIDGITGIIHDKVGDLLDRYNNKFFNVESKFRSIPSHISIYDDSGSFQKSFSTNSSNLINKVESLVDGLKSEIRDALETEIDIILSAKDSSISTLQG